MKKMKREELEALVYAVQDGFDEFATGLNYGPFESAMNALWNYIDGREI